MSAPPAPHRGESLLLPVGFGQGQGSASAGGGCRASHPLGAAPPSPRKNPTWRWRAAGFSRACGGRITAPPPLPRPPLPAFCSDRGTPYGPPPSPLLRGRAKARIVYPPLPPGGGNGATRAETPPAHCAQHLSGRIRLLTDQPTDQQQPLTRPNARLMRVDAVRCAFETLDDDRTPLDARLTTVDARLTTVDAVR